ncbi:putative integral membrane protein [Cryptosporidium felis]|nr:putative integral membrane protein [Cryptosporidium felis]
MNEISDPDLRENANCMASASKFIKPLPKEIAKLALYVVCISDLSSIIQASYDLAFSIMVSTTYVIFSITCSLFGILGFYSTITGNKATTNIYMIYTIARLIFESITSFGMSIIFLYFYKESMYDDHFPLWAVFLINAACLTFSRIVFSYVAYSFYQGLESLNEKTINNLNKV